VNIITDALRESDLYVNDYLNSIGKKSYVQEDILETQKETLKSELTKNFIYNVETLAKIGALFDDIVLPEKSADVFRAYMIKSGRYDPFNIGSGINDDLFEVFYEYVKGAEKKNGRNR
jgi:hypothetical protein